MSSPLLPDVNVWVALHHQIHSHHKTAMSWFRELDSQCTMVFCRQTQLGLFRLLSTEAVMGDEALSQRQCWAIYSQWIAGGKAELLDEPPGVDEALEQRTMSNTVSPKAWMDAYLAAFAETAHLTLVTFDGALAAKAKGAVLLG
jgi:uncharacterized protein